MLSHRINNALHHYLGNLGTRVFERIKHRNGRDTSSNIFKRRAAADDEFVSCDGLRIFGRNYRNNKQKRKAAEALLLKKSKTIVKCSREVSCS